TFQVAAPLAGFTPGGALGVVVRATDRAGNLAESAAVAARVPATLLPIAITEIRANAAGPEPAQEFVEIRNLGAEPLDVGGLAIEDAKGMDVLPAAVLEAGAYALIVPSGFDPSAPEDVPPRDGTTLVRVDSRLGADGLTNSGEVVRLRA